MDTNILRNLYATKLKVFFLLFYSLILHSQTQTDSLFYPKKEKANFKDKVNSTNGTYAYCDYNNDGYLSFNIGQIKNDILNENAELIGAQLGIYICTGYSKVYLLNDLNTNAQQTLVCNFQSQSGWSTSDIATNAASEIFISEYNMIYKINSTTCQIQNTYNYNIGNKFITSLSFDTDNNLYYGGFDSNVYRASGDLSTSQLWHDFGSGRAAGDFVIYNGKMYIAWQESSICRLFAVTIDANNDYVSHLNLGNLPNPTYGLASELGKLYGIHPDYLYEINSGASFTTVLENNSSEKWFGAAGKNEGITFIVEAFETLLDAQNNTNPLPDAWTNTIYEGQIIFVKIKNTRTNQEQIIPVNLVVYLAPICNTPATINRCITDIDYNVFNIRETENYIVGGHENIVVTYYESFYDAINNYNPLPDIYTAQNNEQDIFVQLVNTVTGCINYCDFKLKINLLPTYNEPENLIFCKKKDVPINVLIPLENQTLALLSTLDYDQHQISYYHSNNDAQNQINPIILPYYTNVVQEEIFFTVKNIETTCIAVGSFLIKILDENLNFPEIIKIDSLDWSHNQNSISIAVSGNSMYEYSLDGSNYQSEGLFENLTAGAYNVYVRNMINCGIFDKEVYLLNYPVFFTPNNDGINDFWKIKFSQTEPNIKIDIYDRYGKLVKSMDSESDGWDGTLNNEKLPSADYWFFVKRENGIIFRGHFSLLR